MTYVRFETPEAKFIIAIMSHGKRDAQITPQHSDAFVLEGQCKAMADVKGIFYLPIYSKILEHAKRNEILVFIANQESLAVKQPWFAI